jgi:hypothetical protein
MEKTDTRHFGKQNAHIHAGVSLSKMPHKILHSISISPNTLRKILEVLWIL